MAKLKFRGLCLDTCSGGCTKTSSGGCTKTSSRGFTDDGRRPKRLIEVGYPHLKISFLIYLEVPQKILWVVVVAGGVKLWSKSGPWIDLKARTKLNNSKNSGLP